MGESGSKQTWTVRRIMGWMTDDFRSRGLDTPRLDAELLAAHALGLERIRLYMELDRPLQPDELERVRALVQRRRVREPVAYILGTREFYGRRFRVNSAVLIPRPDTETLVERALNLIDEYNPTEIWDVCTGSGAIGLTLLAEREALRVLLSDISAPALEVARANAEDLQVADRAEFREVDLMDGFERNGADLICINPPYIDKTVFAGLAEDVRLHEPELALTADDNGLAFIERFLGVSAGYLRPAGRILLECGFDQAGKVAEMAASFELSHIKTHRDLAGIDRVVEFARGS